jgi:hypothetical protein
VHAKKGEKSSACTCLKVKTRRCEDKPYKEVVEVIGGLDVKVMIDKGVQHKVDLVGSHRVSLDSY